MLWHLFCTINESGRVVGSRVVSSRVVSSMVVSSRVECSGSKELK